MAGSSRLPTSDKNSIKYRWKGATYEVADFAHEESAPSLPDNNRRSSEKSEPNSSKLLSTSELVSAVGQLWDYARHPLAVQSKANFKNNDSGCQKEDIVGIMGKEEKGKEPTSADAEHLIVDARTTSHILPMVQSNTQFLKVTEKKSISEPCGDYSHSFLWRFLRHRANIPNEFLKGKGLASAGNPHGLGNTYGWVSGIIPSGLKCHVNFAGIGNRDPCDCCIRSKKICSSETLVSATNTAIGRADLSPDLIKSNQCASCDTAKPVVNARGTDSLRSDYFIGDFDGVEADGCVSRYSDSRLCADNHVDSSASHDSVFQECQNRNGGGELLQSEDDSRSEICSLGRNKSQYALAKQEHAFSGALAGICVSLCLHPIDTVKTVIQSCHTDQKSICNVGRSIISERGLTGLYRGITSNIASSAPISAIYTFTYESVKGALLPFFPKEYQSFAHCMAGGCASVATSFIFTPSERVKQQMQIGSHYQNCWKALVGVIGKGGLRSLYAGWGAVLCRNVPHSIIKFYAYESLKQLTLSSLQSSTQPSTLQTLVSGGLAGSTAALFTTPFDVVKTRLQTQIPGSVSQYGNVFHAIQEIGKHEGVKGLYRGLTPRLVMYMTQGAIFFASYEFFKSLFALEAPQLSTKAIQN